MKISVFYEHIAEAVKQEKRSLPDILAEVHSLPAVSKANNIEKMPAGLNPQAFLFTQFYKVILTPAKNTAESFPWGCNSK